MASVSEAENGAIFLNVQQAVRFISLSVGLPVSRSTPSESLLVFPTPSVSYFGVWDRRGVGASRYDGIGDGLVLCLGGGEVGGS